MHAPHPPCLRPILKVILITLGCILALPVQGLAKLQPALPFQDGMVLQREMPLPIWGQATPGATVEVSMGSLQLTTQADRQGRWQVTLPPLVASATERSLVIRSGQESITLNHLLVGEVWLCAGQSNMARTLQGDAREYPIFNEYQANANAPQIRYLNLTTHASRTPLDAFDPAIHGGAKWLAITPQTAPQVMSLAYFFAETLHRELGVPVGLIQVAVPGTPQTAWTHRETLDQLAAAFDGIGDFQTVWDGHEARLAESDLPYKSWAEFEALENSWKANPSGRWPGSGLHVPRFPTVLYNALVHPLAPMAMRGVIWHQGESGPAGQHRERLRAMVKQWQEHLGSELAFIYGSMTRSTRGTPPWGPTWESFRSNIDEEFLLASQSADPSDRLVLVNFFDLGNQGTHWAEKKRAGERMAGAALAEVYGQSERIFTGPELVEATIDGNQVRLTFRHTGGGLIYQPSVDGISGFVIEDRRANPPLRWADVQVAGNEVILSHPEIQTPTNAFYGWHANPHETLFNREGYPAFRFRAVPGGSGPRVSPGPPLVAITEAPQGTSVHLGHVRRNGYLLSLIQGRTQGEATVLARLPKEWSGARVTVEGKPVEVVSLPDDGEGYRAVRFTVPNGTTNIAVVNAAQPPDFSEVDRF